MTRRTAPSLFGLAPDGVYRDGKCYHSPGALLPHPFILTIASNGGLLSVALSLGLPPPGVTRHPVRVGARTFLTTQVVRPSSLLTSAFVFVIAAFVKTAPLQETVNTPLSLAEGRLQSFIQTLDDLDDLHINNAINARRTVAPL